MAKQPPDEWTTRYLAELKKRGVAVEAIPRSLAQQDRGAHPGKSPEEVAEIRSNLMWEASSDPEATSLVRKPEDAQPSSQAVYIPPATASATQPTTAPVPAPKPVAQAPAPVVASSGLPSVLPVNTVVQYEVDGHTFTKLREAVDFAYTRAVEEALGVMIETDVLCANAERIQELTADYLNRIKEG